MKIRFADHNNTHHTDISVQKDWKEAIRYVASVYNDWNEDFNQGETIRFSFADYDIYYRKRMHAIELAKKLYSRLGNDWDESQPMKISEYPSPTQDDKADISYQEMDFLDEDIQFVADRAEAILAKMIAKSDKRNLLDAVPEFELDFERQQVYDKIVEEAIKDFQKFLNLRERVKKQAENNLKKFSKAKHGFSLDELAINGIDLAESHILLINVNNSFRQKKLEQKYSSLLKFDYITYSTSPNIMRCILGVKIFLFSSSTKLKRFPSFGVLR